MKIIITSIGTRGDMEPLLAVGEILRSGGHQIIAMFPEQFRSLAEDWGFEFASLGSKFIEMLDSPAGRIAMGGGKFNWAKIKAYKTLIAVQKDISGEMLVKQFETIEKENPDRVVHNGKVIYPVIWATKNEGKTTLISPVPYLHYVKDHAHIGFNKNYGALINKLTYKIANFGLLKTIMGSLKYLPKDKQIGQKLIQKSLFNNDAIYTVSPSLFKRPDYWKKNIKVLGYHERNKLNNWKPSKELESFLNKYDQIVLVTFGSMINTNPKEKTKIVLDILEKNKIPAIINTASGGLIKPSTYKNDAIFFVDRIPYDYVFPKIYAVIHHGGSGTTHTAIKYGCPCLIIPHIIDQYVWNKIIAKRGIGPLGIDVSKISVRNLEPKFLDLIGNKSYKEKAKEMGKEIKSESYQKDILDFITS